MSVKIYSALIKILVIQLKQCLDKTWSWEYQKQCIAIFCSKVKETFNTHYAPKYKYWNNGNIQLLRLWSVLDTLIQMWMDIICRGKTRVVKLTLRPFWLFISRKGVILLVLSTFLYNPIQNSFLIFNIQIIFEFWMLKFSLLLIFTMQLYTVYTGLCNATISIWLLCILSARGHSNITNKQVTAFLLSDN